MNQLKTFFYSLKQSLFNPSYYKDVAKVGFWFSFKYLWFLLMIIVLIKSATFGATYLKTRPQIAPGINQLMTRVSELYPQGLRLEVEKGQLSTNAKEPYVFDVDYKPGQPHLLVIDTQGTIEDYPYYNAYVLATKNAVVYPSKSQNGNISQTSVFYFTDLKRDFVLDRNAFDYFLDTIRPYTQKAPLFIDWLVTTGLIFFLLFGSLFWSFGTMLGLVFLTVVVWVVARLLGVKYSYGVLYKVGMHAVSWPIIAGEVIKYFKSPFPYFYPIIFFLWIITILFSLKETKKTAPVLLAKKPRGRKKK